MKPAPTILAVVPARGGSKSIPRKNLAELGGETLLARTLAVASQSKHLTRTLVSTDDPEIAAEAARCNSEVLQRPTHLATDAASTFDVLVHVLSHLQATESYTPDLLVCLQPTSPFREARDVDGAVELLVSSGADSVVSVVPSSKHPLWMRTIDEAGRLRPFLDEAAPTRRQDLPPAYALNGAVYVARTASFLALGFGGDCRPWRMPPERSLDVDTPFDLLLAEAMIWIGKRP